VALCLSRSLLQRPLASIPVEEIDFDLMEEGEEHLLLTFHQPLHTLFCKQSIQARGALRGLLLLEDVGYGSEYLDIVVSAIFDRVWALHDDAVALIAEHSGSWVVWHQQSDDLCQENTISFRITCERHVIKFTCHEGVHFDLIKP